MSTIEEAREQAREALATLDQELLEWLLGERSWVDQHHGRPDEIEMTARADRATIQLLTTRQAALRALLDATEPPACKVRFHGEPGCICPASTGGGAPAMQYADSTVVAETAAKIAGENTELMARLADKPAEDEREGLEQAIGYELVPLSIRNHPEIRFEFRTTEDRDGLVDRILAAGYRKGPRPVTDEMVEDAREAWADWSEQSEPGTDWESFRAGYRAALEAAEGARR